jgi:hypothetical protein
MEWSTNRKILTACAAAATAGVPGAFGGPGTDLGPIVGIWSGLFVALAADESIALDKFTAIKIVTSILASIGLIGFGTKTALTVFAWTGVGTVVAVLLNSSINAAMTFVFGQAVLTVLRSTDKKTSDQELGKAVLSVILGVFGIPFSGPDDSA